jgi:superfamily II DNA or RNA helicase
MQKAVISNKIYLGGLTNEQLKSITESLTYQVEKNTATRLPNGKISPRKQIEYIKNYSLLPGNILTIPQGRTDLIPEGYELVDKRVKVEVPFPNPLSSLRESQQEVYDKVQDTCFINAKVGWGKTYMALHLARKLGQKTLVITHTVNLMNQWIEQAEILFGSRVGKITSGVYDVEDHFIVVGNIQSLIKHKVKICKEFGTLILDEAHHVPATTFTDFIDGMYCRYRIGLSGTMERKDGKHVLLTDFFSQDVYKPPVDNTLPPLVHILKPGVFLERDKPWAVKINKLLYDPDYQQFIAGVVNAAIVRGHSVLVIASRIEFLQKVKEYVGETCVLVTGETDDDARKRVAEQIDTGQKRAIAGSRQIFSEGISINRLSAVVLAEPMSHGGLVEQIIGRIQRQHPSKPSPEVYDINFSDGASRKQNQDRLSLYIEKGWEIKTY